MGKTRDLFQKIRDTKGNFHAKMGTIKYRNGMDLTEAEDIKKRWQEYTEEYTKKIFMTQIIMSLGSIPESGRSPREGNGNPLQYSCLENLMDRGAW